MRAAAMGALFAAAVAGGALAGWLTRESSAVRGAGPATERAAVPPPQLRSACEFAPAGGGHPGMVWVPGGSFTMGADGTYPEEGPSRTVAVEGFWMDQTEVTNAQFAQFVAATGHVTGAEREGGSAVFRAPVDVQALRSPDAWWHFVPGADWRHPEGPGSNLAGRAHLPVVHVAYEDAVAYAEWKGRSLPTEAQFELAAQGDARRGGAGTYLANTWQGRFPVADLATDGFAGIAPVGCFPANRHGLHDLIGNVWEWTGSAYFERHDAAGPRPGGFDPRQPDEPLVSVVKGGSYLCSPDYCMRYRPAARLGQAHAITSAHIGFRTVLADAGP